MTPEERQAARARRIRASNEAYDLRCLTGNISNVIEEDLTAALDELDAKDAEVERLEKWAQAIGYDLSAVEECQRTHVQNCTACPRLECCDNLSPIHEYGVKLNRLEGECERLRGALQTIVSRGEVFDAKGTHSKTTVQIARATLEGRDSE